MDALPFTSLQMETMRRWSSSFFARELRPIARTETV
jgi:hypothetical protein